MTNFEIWTIDEYNWVRWLRGGGFCIVARNNMSVFMFFDTTRIRSIYGKSFNIVQYTPCTTTVPLSFRAIGAIYSPVAMLMVLTTSWYWIVRMHAFNDEMTTDSELYAYIICAVKYEFSGVIMTGCSRDRHAVCVSIFTDNRASLTKM